MGVIAVAGGTGPVGKTIVDALVALGQHKIYVLSRSKPSPQEGVEHLQSNYSDVSATAKSLEDAGIDTVICAMGVVTPESNQAQLNLIQAAKESKPTQRFVISGFDMLHLKEHIEISVLAKYTYEAIDALEQTELEYTRVANGWFMDYYGLPFWKTHLHPWINVVHMEKKWAAIPGDGSVKATFITSQDMAKFVAHLMSLEKWDKVTLIDGETISMNELLKLAEDARGCKFQVEHDSLEKLKSGHISFASEFPAIGFGDGDQAFYAMVHYQAGVGRYHIPDGEKLNGKFPNIKLTSMKEVMDTCWKGKDL